MKSDGSGEMHTPHRERASERNRRASIFHIRCVPEAVGRLWVDLTSDLGWVSLNLDSPTPKISHSVPACLAFS